MEEVTFLKELGRLTVCTIGMSCYYRTLIKLLERVTERRDMKLSPFEMIESSLERSEYECIHPKSPFITNEQDWKLLFPLSAPLPRIIDFKLGRSTIIVVIFKYSISLSTWID